MEQFPVDTSLNSLGLAPLHMAACGNNKVIFELLMSYNPNVNIQDGMGRTPLHFAVANENLSALDILLSSPNILIDAQSLGGETPLMRAISFGKKESAAKLLEKGANITLKNNGGLTAVDLVNSNPSSSLMELIQGHVSQLQ
mmetsp:Transcript_37522/g.36078  ORF Transcript_37522/g.36078 Transcript_37522/m.36078 type:complete len:142 (-) Transcript_37522:99-524(-)|eukprot:CAMPEP_0170547562 /NCGR_PEP_ID=MMETSP0211-20121228/5975_1 /TAXON_ID=311385 /ORGANISM="Pseudokeronopsis sp., Strain OXSARD2" /LENGTH=141 /DNA_ID=CAMNT_0010852691 /DNA_START=51 /DNA_END=476 /DNA_ORIENTATION=+